jgi:hypothetical protein
VTEVATLFLPRCGSLCDVYSAHNDRAHRPIIFFFLREAPMAIFELFLLAILSIWTIAICLRCAVVVYSIAKQLPTTKCDGSVTHFA